MASIKHRIKDLLNGLPALSPLALMLAIRRPSRLPIFISDCIRAYRHHAGLRIPAITPWELLDFKAVVTLKMGENDLYSAMEPNFLMMQLVAMLRPERMFEIGTSQGRTTALIAMNTPETTKIWTLDLPPDVEVPKHASDLQLIELAKTELGIAFRNTNWASRITQLTGDSAKFDFSPYYDSMDMVTVDGSHTYEFVCRDSANAFRMIRPGGIILWHDYESLRSEYGVMRFVDGLRRVHGLPVYRLARDSVGMIRSPDDNRYAVMRVDAKSKQALMNLAKEISPK